MRNKPGRNVASGLLAIGLGIWMMDHHLLLGWSTFVAGGASCLAGVILIWVRSHRD